MPDPRDLEGKVCIVTGAGRGLGKSIALALAGAGSHLVVVSRTRAEIEQTAHEISKLNRRAIPVVADVSASQDVGDMARRALSEFQRIDALFNNAGMAGRRLLIHETEEEWDRMMAVNLKGLFLCSKAVIPTMMAQKRGKIINTASTSGVLAEVGYVSYCVSKAGVIMFTRALALELCRHNITVNAIAPGWFKTSMTRRIHDDRERYAQVVGRIPMGRMADPEEIGPLAVFLASSASDFMTGETVFYDGGEAAGIWP
jgi:NAD(P)-dependent dehydrogenase (short-subunit alcohol dehydrogenase family)